MTLFTDTQLADLGARSRTLLDQMKQIVRQGAGAGDLVRPVVAGLQEIPALYDRPGVAFAVRSWCDAVIEASGHEPGRPIEVVYAAPDGRSMVAREFILPERQWASDVLAARFASEHVTLYRLLDQLPAGTETFIHLFRLVEIAASLLVAHESPPDGPIKPGLHHVGAN